VIVLAPDPPNKNISTEGFVFTFKSALSTATFNKVANYS